MVGGHLPTPHLHVGPLPGHALITPAFFALFAMSMENAKIKIYLEGGLNPPWSEEGHENNLESTQELR